jgi:hypothetical protein
MDGQTGKINSWDWRRAAVRSFAVARKMSVALEVGIDRL